MFVDALEQIVAAAGGTVRDINAHGLRIANAANGR
jgi:hypothetical protein